MKSLAKELKAVFHQTHLSELMQWEAIAQRANSYSIGGIEECPQSAGPLRVVEPLTKLEQFTMAAMQGLLASGRIGSVVYDLALSYAKTTLAQLKETDT